MAEYGVPVNLDRAGRKVHEEYHKSLEVNAKMALDVIDEVKGAGDYATAEGDRAKEFSDNIETVMKDGPTQTVNGRTGQVTGLAEQVDLDATNAQLADTAVDVNEISVIVRSSGGDDTQSILDAANFIQINGGGKILMPDEVYQITTVPDTSIRGAAQFTFSKLNKVEIECLGVIRDNTVYDRGLVERSILFNFEYCHNIRITSKVNSQKPTFPMPGSKTEGLRFVQFVNGCTNIKLDIDAVGCRNVVNFYREDKDNEEPSKNIKANIKAVDSRYPYLSEYSGYNAVVNLDVMNCGRNFFLFGVSDVSLFLKGKNQRITSLIKSYYGYGCRNIKVYYEDLESDMENEYNNLIGIEWGDINPATHENIEITLNVYKKIPLAWARTLQFRKQTNGVDEDATGRGHVLDGFSLFGKSKNNNNPHVNIAEGSEFRHPDKQRNINVGDLELKGGRTAVFPFSNLDGPALFKNVVTDSLISTGNGDAREVVFENCRASAFTLDIQSNDRHSYNNCEITGTQYQNYDKNKKFINTNTPAGVINRQRTVGIQGSISAGKIVNGDLTVERNLFELGGNVRGYFKLSYYLVDDDRVINHNRRETYGVKVFSANTNNSGEWNLRQEVEDLEGPKTHGQNPSNLTIKLNSKGVISVVCTNYGDENSVGVFKLDSLLTNEITNIDVL